MPEPHERTFETTQERDEWITENYPERKMTSSPGLYAVNGGSLSVFLRTVTFYPGGRVRPTYSESKRG